MIDTKELEERIKDTNSPLLMLTNYTVLSNQIVIMKALIDIANKLNDIKTNYGS